MPAGLPTPGTAFPDAAKFFSGDSAALHIASALGPLSWVLATIFGVGAVALWSAEPGWALVGLSMGGLWSGLIRRWRAVLGFSSAVLLFGSATLSVGLIGLFGWLLWVVWIGTYGVTLIRLRS
ncbi:hypothetical protein [Kibdelosporangium aridum]|uniref:DUF4233 domain-containing protein n=1 Tax=Kibdelosporangium aridum TaxID=2030 RepID=A0A1Y5XVM0_KIBAR|nr:hypothetical protein [Kibdelosporangium aridum]SMD18856.1 hypothetical protein SAMN05661093_05931 [Kibdelosporangium aridum]